MMNRIIFSVFLCLIPATVLAEANPTSSELVVEVCSAFVLFISKLPNFFFVKVPLLIIGQLIKLPWMLFAIFRGDINEFLKDLPLLLP